jgi:hypothetical protein
MAGRLKRGSRTSVRPDFDREKSGTAPNSEVKVMEREQNQVKADSSATPPAPTDPSPESIMNAKLRRMRELGFTVEESPTDSGPFVIVGSPRKPQDR